MNQEKEVGEAVIGISAAVLLFLGLGLLLWGGMIGIAAWLLG